jgi:hypothetical protein
VFRPIVHPDASAVAVRCDIVAGGWDVIVLATDELAADLADAA